ncbi:hypothetical protein C2S51_036107 [Perilla frutescens var. frutescens]|nr:hypothetical protein C2S51_036107 [Perilla frutescens var. frutescens]
MTKNPVSLDKWRDYFSSSNSDIFSIIEHAIMVAASDCPYDFKVKRDRIAEMLFTCKMTKCLGCDRTELSVAFDDCLKGIDGDDELKTGVEAGGSKDSKESKVNSSSRDDDDDHIEVTEVNAKYRVRDQDYDDIEALTDEIEEESQFLEEVVRIKEVLDDSEGKSAEVLFESLRRLQLMPLSVEILKSTEIGKSVYALRKHGSKEIRNLGRRLVVEWKRMVDAWVDATTAIVGLPSPPLDEVAFLGNPTSMELSQFFDCMDDDGNLRNCGEFNNNRQNGRMRIPERTDIPMQKSPADSKMPPKDSKAGNPRNREVTMKKEAPPCKPNAPGRPKPRSSEMGARRPNAAMQTNANNVVKVQQNGTIQKKPLPQQQEKLNRVNEVSDQMRLEAAKRKLHERYQEAENAKKQRTIQVVELRDLPKQSHAHRNQQTRPGNHHSQRQRAQGRW